jgi:F-type H+-transporting ATPase subunit gamma
MGANIKAIRARIKSVDSTKHITKAMQLVASSKIRRASAKMEQSRFYREVLLEAFSDLSAEKSAYSVQRSSDLPAVYIIVAGDRGLAGGYNNNIFRSAMTMLREKDLVLPIGKRAVDYYKSHGNVITDEFMSAENFSAEDSAKAAYLLRDMYDRGEISSIALISTKLVSMLSQEPCLTRLLPLEKNEEDGAKKEPEVHAVVEYEPGPEEVLAALIPEYISGAVYTSVTESFAAELAARRSAMDTATKNADAMLDDLSLKYNRARQSAITQEITEIVAGANA